MNDFRDRVLGGKPLRADLLRSKQPRSGGAGETVERGSPDLSIPREEARQSNHRDSDRHRLAGETVELVHAGASQHVTLINLSGGGAMVEGAEGLKLWDRVELRFAEWSRVEAAVRWIRGKRFGLEFAHETRVETDDAQLHDMLRAVIHRSFPDISLAADQSDVQAKQAAEPVTPAAAQDAAQEDGREQADRELRHPLIWSGEVHYDHDTITVRLRNISNGGALVECASPLRSGAELLLDLGPAGTVFASVHWSRADAAGLKFHTPFDVKRLAAARPKVATERWVAPAYLSAHSSDNSPWAKQWGRSDLDTLHRRLAGSAARL